MKMKKNLDPGWMLASLAPPVSANAVYVSVVTFSSNRSNFKPTKQSCHRHLRISKFNFKHHLGNYCNLPESPESPLYDKGLIRLNSLVQLVRVFRLWV